MTNLPHNYHKRNLVSHMTRKAEESRTEWVHFNEKVSSFVVHLMNQNGITPASMNIDQDHHHGPRRGVQTAEAIFLLAQLADKFSHYRVASQLRKSALNEPRPFYSSEDDERSTGSNQVN